MSYESPRPAPGESEKLWRAEAQALAEKIRQLRMQSPAELSREEALEILRRRDAQLKDRGE